MPQQSRFWEQEIDLAQWERRKAFVGFTAEDERLLQTLRPHAERFLDQVVDEMYRRWMQFQETKAYFPDAGTLQRVKKLQTQYFRGLLAGEYGAPYLAYRLQIGRVHQRIGLSPRWYMGAYAMYFDLIMPHVLDSFGEDTQTGRAALAALHRIIMLDEELAITTYFNAREEIIAHQAEEILQISTPVVQVWQGVVAAPLIGALDSQRTQLFMERLLQVIVESNSSVALVDITGVPAMDTATAQHLIETISAVRLLGADVVLTGVSAAIAQTLVHLGIDLSHVTTRSSLAAGLQVALKKLDLRVVAENQAPG